MNAINERERAAITDTGVLRFITAGSVDDGKSTLIGRLLHDTRAIFEDQLAAVKRATAKRGQEELDLSLLTDGLEAEREQGITIDVAYRYFATPQRKFIIADTPGHEQYTRNMVTGASTADAAVILVDARKGVLTQTRRHTYIAHLLGVRHIIVAVNKMDLVNYDQAVFERIRADFLGFSEPLGIDGIQFIPLSALRGDQVVEAGDGLPWYRGSTLLEALESINVLNETGTLPARFPVQLVVRPGAGTDFRGFAGRLSSGALSVGDEVLVLPSQKMTRIRKIISLERELPIAVAGDSVTLMLEDEIDISRGDMLVDVASPPQALKSLRARICWLSEEPLSMASRLILKHTSRSVKAKIVAIADRVDVNMFETQAALSQLRMNDIAHVGLSLAQPVFIDAYVQNRETGAFILIDEATHQTVAAGMIESK